MRRETSGVGTGCLSFHRPAAIASSLSNYVMPSRLTNHRGLSISRPTTIDLNPPTPTSKFKPIRIRGMCFVAATRITSCDNLAFKNIPSYQEFQAAMVTPSFQQRVRHDREMRKAHVRTMEELFDISPNKKKPCTMSGMLPKRTPPHGKRRLSSTRSSRTPR